MGQKHNPRDRRATGDAALAHARRWQRFIIARLVGLSCLGLGVITAVFGVTNTLPFAVRSGQALLIFGVIATLISYVFDFVMRRAVQRSRTS